eukprot:TRINITY_DN21186_c0_g1_i2.p2 TRINITY_DN21186_c0_g1~~TRINITY_DN21186_c0_g1_i2.p2  ORF type:complete len:137 (-),score=43.11 TRINITY_DN21186_c0_g1_i2:170-580(-)
MCIRDRRRVHGAKKQVVLKKGVDLPVPLVNQEAEEGKSNEKFGFVIKKGTKQVVRKLEIPDNSSLVISYKKHITEEEEERYRMKDLTLNIVENVEEGLGAQGFSDSSKSKYKAEDQLAKGKKKVHFSYQDFSRKQH